MFLRACHSSCTPDLAPSNYWLFLYMIKWLSWKRFHWNKPNKTLFPGNWRITLFSRYQRAGAAMKNKNYFSLQIKYSSLFQYFSNHPRFLNIMAKHLLFHAILHALYSEILIMPSIHISLICPLKTWQHSLGSWIVSAPG